MITSIIGHVEYRSFSCRCSTVRTWSYWRRRVSPKGAVLSRRETDIATQGPIPDKPPSQRTVSVRSLVTALDGPEKPYDVYRFSGNAFYERPRHNPFEGLEPPVLPDPPQLPGGVIATHTLTVGDAGDGVQYGFESDAGYGAIDPVTDQATAIRALENSVTRLRYSFVSSGSPYGTDLVYPALRIYFPESPAGSYDLTWVGGFAQEYRFEVGDSSLRDYLAALVDVEVPIRIEALANPNDFVLSTVIDGSFSGYDSAGLGAIAPGTWNGETITAIGASTLGTDHVKVNFNNTQVAGVTSISVTFEGAADNPYVLPWNAGTTDYRLLGVVATTLNTYLDGITGTDIDVTINDAT